MKKYVEVEIDFSGKDMARELLSSDEIEQADFLLELARTYRFNLSEFSKQLEHLSYEIKNSYDMCDKTLIIKVLEKVLEYIRGDEEWFVIGVICVYQCIMK